MKNPDLLTESYNFELDKSMIAERPASGGRHSSKLLVYDEARDQVIHGKFSDLSKYIPSESLVMMNQSKVFPCRLQGERPSGGKVEVFILSLIKMDHGYHVLIGANGKKRVGDIYHFGSSLTATLNHRSSEGEFYVSFNLEDQELFDFLEMNASIPIPPYIRDGIADDKDKVDYQTIYAKEVGSVAAPTAGLHFTEEVFSSLEKKGIEKGFVTLHVGAGTFKPVSVENILDHHMHAEYYTVDSESINKLNSGKDIFAVGTTSLRVIESILSKNNDRFLHNSNEFASTDIFLHPGKEVKSIKGLITNFHLPKSTLLMLVSSLLGREKTLELYEIAKENNYRFFSYGDAMLILRK